MTELSDAELRELAISRIKRQQSFINYLWTWLGVSIVVIVVWMMTGFGEFWPGWVIFGMGIGALFNAISAVRAGTLLAPSVIDHEIAKLKGSPKAPKKSNTPKNVTNPDAK